MRLTMLRAAQMRAVIRPCLDQPGDRGKLGPVVLLVVGQHAGRAHLPAISRGCSRRDTVWHTCGQHTNVHDCSGSIQNLGTAVRKMDTQFSCWMSSYIA
jgi:hypothetical protein